MFPGMGRPVARQGSDKSEGVSNAEVSSQQAVSMVPGLSVNFSEGYSFHSKIVSDCNNYLLSTSFNFY